jgi:hypothetical protein
VDACFRLKFRHWYFAQVNRKTRWRGIIPFPFPFVRIIKINTFGPFRSVRRRVIENILVELLIVIET